MSLVAYKTYFKTCIVFTAIVVLCGCTSIVDSRKQKTELTTAYKTGNLKKACQIVSEKNEDHKESGDSIMWLLESGLIKFDSGDYVNSLKAFEDAETKINEHDERATISARNSGAETGSAITNPTAIPYKGLYCDRALLNVYKAMVYLALNDLDAARVEMRRMRDVQKRIERQFSDDIEREQKITEAANRKTNAQSRQLSRKQRGGNIDFKILMKNSTIKKAYEDSAKRSEKAYGNFMNPFSTYMSAIAYLCENNYNEACVDFRNLYRMNKNNPLTNRDFVTCARKIGAKIPPELKNIPSWDYSLNNNIAFVIFANGHAPALKQTKIQLVLPYVGYTGIAFPQYEYFKRFFSKVILTNGNKSYTTVPLADMDAILAQEYHKRLPTMITRLVISYLVKETAALVAVQFAKQQGAAAELIAYGATGLYKYLFNTADTRCWETLPGEYQMVHFPISKERQLKLKIPSNVSAEEISINLKKDTKLAVIYIRGGNKKIISVKTFEFNNK
jgi:uncharacterized protein